jgi:hypothetical protein
MGTRGCRWLGRSSTKYRRALGLAGAAIVVLAAQARAEDLSGVIVVAGPEASAATMLAPPQDTQGPTLCPSDNVRRLRHLSGMTAATKGGWQLSPAGQKTCFDVTEFTITKLASGRDAVVGVLKRHGAGFDIVGDGGKVLFLSEITDGLRKLEGLKVIVELRPSQGPTAHEATFKVVSFALFP